MACSNCNLTHTGLDDVCLLSALARLVVDRDQTMSREVLAFVNQAELADELWEQLGPVVDWLADQFAATQAPDPDPRETAGDIRFHEDREEGRQ
jgi:hypothetical protein